MKKINEKELANMINALSELSDDLDKIGKKLQDIRSDIGAISKVLVDIALELDEISLDKLKEVEK